MQLIHLIIKRASPPQHFYGLSLHYRLSRKSRIPCLEKRKGNCTWSLSLECLHERTNVLQAWKRQNQIYIIFYQQLICPNRIIFYHRLILSFFQEQNQIIRQISNIPKDHAIYMYLDFFCHLMFTESTEMNHDQS